MEELKPKPDTSKKIDQIKFATEPHSAPAIQVPSMGHMGGHSIPYCSYASHNSQMEELKPKPHTAKKIDQKKIAAVPHQINQMKFATETHSTPAFLFRPMEHMGNRAKPYASYASQNSRIYTGEMNPSLDFNESKYRNPNAFTDAEIRQYSQRLYQPAKRAAKRQQSVDNQLLGISQHTPPRPFYEDKILVKGLKDTITQNSLFYFLEAKSGSVPTQMWRGEMEGVVIVVFENEPNFHKLEDVCKEFPLEGSYLKVERVQMTNCIIVSNLPDGTNVDVIHLYFENTRRSYGGDIDKVVMRDEDGSCLVYFMDYEVVDNVLEKTHTILGVKLIVKLYIDGFGCPGVKQKETALKLPDVISITDVDDRKINFMQFSKPNNQAISMQMRGVNAEIIWPEKARKEKDGRKQRILIKCSITKDTKNAEKLVKTWRKDAEENFNHFMKTILVQTLHVSQDLWNVTMDKLRNYQIKYPEGVAILVEKDQLAISVVGLVSAVNEVYKDLKSMFKNTEDEVAREKAKSKETISGLKLIETNMLLSEKFPSKMEVMFKESDLKVKVNVNRNEITFHGLLKDINAAKILMYEMKNNFASVSVDMKGCRSMFLLYENKPVKDYIMSKLTNHQVAAVWEVQDQKIVVCSTREDTLDKAVEIVTKAVVEVSVDLSRENSEAIQAPAWRNVEEELAQRFPGKVDFEIRSTCIYVCSTDDILREVLGVVKRYLKSNTIIEEHVYFSRNITKIISEDHEKAISRIYDSLIAQITPKTDNSGFIIRGTEDQVQAMKRELEFLRAGVLIKDITQQSPGIEDHMKWKGRDHLTPMENKVHVVFSAADDSEPEYDELDNLSGPRVYAECRAYEDRKIYTAEGDMTELPVDVLVNTADSKLSLTGGLGKAVAAKGGNEVLIACTDYLRDEGELSEGEAFISPAGRLRASYVVHIVGPVWRGGTNNEDTILADSVIKAMQQATVKNVKSVALPAISCGVNGFPVKRATKIIVRGVNNFFREVQQSTIMEVYLCDVKTNTIECFTEALVTEFGYRNVRRMPQRLPTPRGEKEECGLIVSSRKESEEVNIETGVTILPETKLEHDEWKDAIENSNLTKMILLMDMGIVPDNAQLQFACQKYGYKAEAMKTLCDGICSLILTEHKHIVSVVPSYKLDKPNNIVFVVYLNKHSWNIISFKDFRIKSRVIGQWSTEGKDIARKEDFKPLRFTEDELRSIAKSTDNNSERLFQKHSNLQMISPSHFRSSKFGKGRSVIEKCLCIALYVPIKGYIPLSEEPFPTHLDGLPTDVREGGFRFLSNPTDPHKNVKMGCGIAGVEGVTGSIGPFFQDQDKIYFLTASHVLFDIGQVSKKCKEFEWRVDPPVDVYQPNPLNRAGESNIDLPLGKVRDAFYMLGTGETPGMELAVVEITDTERIPLSGEFPDSRDEPMDCSDTDTQNVQSDGLCYNSGDVVEKHFVENRCCVDVVKFGAATRKTSSRVNHFKFSAKGKLTDADGVIVLLNQLEILETHNGIVFADRGDSGSLILADINGELRALGSLVGQASTGRIIATPIYAILDELQRRGLMSERRFLSFEQQSTQTATAAGENPVPGADEGRAIPGSSGNTGSSDGRRNEDRLRLSRVESDISNLQNYVTSMKESDISSLQNDVTSIKGKVDGLDTNVNKISTNIDKMMGFLQRNSGGSHN